MDNLPIRLDNFGKPELIPDNILNRHGSKVKDGLAVTYRWIRAALASW